MGGYLREGGLFNVEKTMVSVLHKELEYKVQEVGGHEACDVIALDVPLVLAGGLFYHVLLVIVVA